MFFSSRGGKADTTSGVWTWRAVRSRHSRAAARFDINPFFSPDGKEIVFQSDSSGRLELWVMAADGYSCGNSPPSARRGTSSAGSATATSTSEPVVAEAAARIADRRRAAADDRQRRLAHLLLAGLHAQHRRAGPQGALVEPTGQHAGPQAVRVRRRRRAHRLSRVVSDGKWLLFDWFKPKEGDLWVAEMEARRVRRTGARTTERGSGTAMTRKGPDLLLSGSRCVLLCTAPLHPRPQSLFWLRRTDRCA